MQFYNQPIMKQYSNAINHADRGQKGQKYAKGEKCDLIDFDRDMFAGAR